jgi:hypothetical protein
MTAPATWREWWSSGLFFRSRSSNFHRDTVNRALVVVTRGSAAWVWQHSITLLLVPVLCSIFGLDLKIVKWEGPTEGHEAAATSAPKGELH